MINFDCVIQVDNMKVRGHLSAIFLLLSVALFSQMKNDRSFKNIRSVYENLPKNEDKALPFVKEYITKAKKESNFEKLTQGYRDAVFFSPASRDKLIYSDSMIYASLKSRDEGLMTLAYLGKGIIYYFNYKKYEPALNEYLKAYDHSKNTDNQYLKFKVTYHLGVVKSYLGYYDDAIEHFNSSIGHFELQIRNKQLHPNEIFNDKKGYYNSLHQMIICHRQLKHFDLADSLIATGLTKINNERDFSLEKSYLLKCRGISNLNRSNYEGAIVDLDRALPELLAKDFAWASVAYFYLGKSYLTSDSDLAIENFQRVDSIFIERRFILPELRENYELLIKHYRNEKDVNKELYYTNQLLSVDSIISKDFTYLSSRIHKEYDRKTLLDKKEFLENRVSNWIKLVIVLTLLTICCLILAGYRFITEKRIKLKYQILQQKLVAASDGKNFNLIVETNENRRSALSEETILEITKNLQLFEEKRGFLKAGLSLNDLAIQMNTNSSYLSIFINEYKGGNYKNYINSLRIAYITDLLNTNRKYLHYTIEALAAECGIVSRQNFSDLFFETNGIRPKDFIRKRKEEVDQM